MKINRELVKKVFKDYVADYDLMDVKVTLKVAHTYRVAVIADRISESLGWCQEDQDLGWLSGMLHDIGRFEQLRRYHSFRDALTCDHAELSADILFNDGLIARFYGQESDELSYDTWRDSLEEDEKSELDLIEKVIRAHNKLLLPMNLTEREKMFADLLRDADKVDILRVNCETPRSEIYDLPEEEFATTAISPEVWDDVMNGRTVNRAHSRTAIDFLVGHISFVNGLVYPESLVIVKEQGFLKQMLEFDSKNPDTRGKLQTLQKKFLNQ